MQNSDFAVPIFTAWTTTAGYDPAQEFGITPEDAALYDALFREHAKNIVSSHMPWLFEALAEAGALLIGAAPSTFKVVLRDGSHRHVPDLEALLHLFPWREPGETCH